MEKKEPPVLEYEPESEADESGKWIDYLIQIVVNIALILAVTGLVMYLLFSRGGSPGS